MNKSQKYFEIDKESCDFFCEYFAVARADAQVWRDLAISHTKALFAVKERNLKNLIECLDFSHATFRGSPEFLAPSGTSEEFKEGYPQRISGEIFIEISEDLEVAYTNYTVSVLDFIFMELSAAIFNGDCLDFFKSVSKYLHAGNIDGLKLVCDNLLNLKQENIDLYRNQIRSEVGFFDWERLFQLRCILLDSSELVELHEIMNIVKIIDEVLIKNNLTTVENKMLENFFYIQDFEVFKIVFSDFKMEINQTSYENNLAMNYFRNVKFTIDSGSLPSLKFLIEMVSCQKQNNMVALEDWLIFRSQENARGELAKKVEVSVGETLMANHNINLRSYLLPLLIYAYKKERPSIRRIPKIPRSTNRENKLIENRKSALINAFNFCKGVVEDEDNFIEFLKFIELDETCWFPIKSYIEIERGLKSNANIPVVSDDLIFKI